jgi:hypothetical protein
MAYTPELNQSESAAISKEKLLSGTTMMLLLRTFFNTKQKPLSLKKWEVFI